MAETRHVDAFEMPNLPAERWLDIFEYIRPKRTKYRWKDLHDEGGSSRLHTLTSVALTCRTFSRIVQPALYTHIRTQLQSIEQLYELAVTLIEQPRLRGYVREAFFWSPFTPFSPSKFSTQSRPNRTILQTLLPYALDINCSARICRSLISKLPSGGLEAVCTILLALCSNLQTICLDVAADDSRVGTGLPIALILESAELPCNCTLPVWPRYPLSTTNGVLSNQSNFPELREVEVFLHQVGACRNKDDRLAPHIVVLNGNETFELPTWADVSSALLLPALERLTLSTDGDFFQLDTASILVGEDIKPKILNLG